MFLIHNTNQANCDTEILHLDFQRRFQNVVYDTPEIAWICTLRLNCI